MLRYNVYNVIEYYIISLYEADEKDARIVSFVHLDVIRFTLQIFYDN